MKQFQLTKREIEIIGLVGQSFTNEEIADKLFLSVATVKTHRNNINLKLGINKPADLVKFAVEHGLTNLGKLINQSFLVFGRLNE